MLIVCPECQHQVSDKATVCIGCGYPLKKSSKKRNRRMRLPNGFGRITKLTGGNYRNPYRAMVTVGKTEDGKPIGKILKPQGYFKTYNEAYEALVEYNKNPYELSEGITVEELYNEWSEKYFKEVSDSMITQITTVWPYCSDIYSMRVSDVRVRHIKGVMENGFRIEKKGDKKGEKIFATPGTKVRIKSLLSKMLDYAVENEVTDKNYAKLFKYSADSEKDLEEAKESHIAFSEDELAVLWENVGNFRVVEWILIECYTGFRPGELVSIKVKDVDLTQKTIIGGMKTKSGYRRTVPIHSRVFDLVEKNIGVSKAANLTTIFSDKTYENSKYSSVNYERYKYLFDVIMKKLNLNPDHRPHDCRKTFATRLTRAGADPWAVKKLLGHSVKDVTEGSYVDRDIEWLRNDLEKMK